MRGFPGKRPGDVNPDGSSGESAARLVRGVHNLLVARDQLALEEFRGRGQRFGAPVYGKPKSPDDCDRRVDR